MSYDGAGEFSNIGQSATAVGPDELFDWHGLITAPTPPLDSSGLFPALPTQTTQEGVSYPSWNLCTVTAGNWADNEVATFSTSWTVLNPYWVQSLNWIATCEGLDCPAFPDFDDDSDGVTVCEDNCPDDPNPARTIATLPWVMGWGMPVTAKATLTAMRDCDGTDAATFKLDFGRSTFDRSVHKQ